MIGCDADRDSQFAYIEHLRKAFKMEPKRHLELFEAAEARPPPAGIARDGQSRAMYAVDLGRYSVLS